MEATQKFIEFFRHVDGRCPGEEWLDSLSEGTHAILLKRFDRLEQGNFGDSKPLGDGVIELRIHTGPGYRLFIGQLGNLVVVLSGCDKSEQRRTIPVAKALWKEYKRRIV